ncbi:ankyrin repeat domain-containing protein, partial [bacterium]|nr:ankyrin repeat domain-containing protein [bacterium]
TPLHYASASGDKEIIELLIGKDADLNATDKFGKTPLDLANMNGRTETADLLRKHGGKTKKELEAEGN